MGKGDKRRPTQVEDKQFINSWCKTFGHKTRDDSSVCVTCGVIVDRYVSNTEDKDIIPNRVRRHEHGRP